MIKSNKKTAPTGIKYGTIQIAFGALQPKVSTQIKKQGYKFNKDKADLFEKCRQSILYLVFNGIITDKAADKCQEKLIKKIISHVRKLNPAPKTKAA